MNGLLFETTEDRAVNHAMQLLEVGYRGVELTARQRVFVRRLLDHRGVERAMPLSRVAALLGCSEREVKKEIHDLRVLFRLRVGTLRTGDGGCYLITSSAEMFDTVRPFIRQAVSEFAVVRAIAEPHELKELEGQLQISAPVEVQA